MANTTWSTTDKTAGVTLSGLNLIATSTGSGAWVRAADRQVTGKFYWEVRMTTWANGSTGIGLTNATTTPTAWNTAGTLQVCNNGAIYISGAQQASLGARASNDILSFALDVAAQFIWVRVAPAGNWNGLAGVNPASGVGGVSISSFGGGAVPVLPMAQFSAASEVANANFGDSAFSGVVPAGFTSGFTAGASFITSAVATQLAAEHWLTVNPAAQLTQIAVEQWATVATGNTQAVLTQIAIEHWASVATATPGGTTQSRVMILA